MGGLRVFVLLVYVAEQIVDVGGRGLDSFRFAEDTIFLVGSILRDVEDSLLGVFDVLFELQLVAEQSGNLFIQQKEFFFY